MKRNILSILTLALMAAPTMADQITTATPLKLVDGDSSSVETIQCVNNIGTRTTGEAERLRRHDCHRLVIKNAKMQKPNGEFVTLPELKVGPLSATLSMHIASESKTCVDKYKDALNSFLRFKKRTNRADAPIDKFSIGNEKFNFPDTYYIRNGDSRGEYEAEAGIANVEIGRRGGNFFEQIGALSASAINGTNSLLRNRDVFSVSDTANNRGVCLSSARHSDLNIDDGLYAQQLDGNVIQDTRRVSSNWFNRALGGASNLTSRATSAISQ